MTPRAVRKALGKKRAWKAMVDLQPAAGKTGAGKMGEYQMAIRLERMGA